MKEGNDPKQFKEIFSSVGQGYLFQFDSQFLLLGLLGESCLLVLPMYDICLVLLFTFSKHVFCIVLCVYMILKFCISAGPECVLFIICFSTYFCLQFNIQVKQSVMFFSTSCMLRCIINVILNLLFTYMVITCFCFSVFVIIDVSAFNIVWGKYINERALTHECSLYWGKYIEERARTHKCSLYWVNI